MDLLQLRYFYDSAKSLSISQTARKYMVPPTSVSASIRRLEEELARVNDSACFSRIISSGVAVGVGGELSWSMGFLPALKPLNVVDFQETQSIYVYYKDPDDPETQRFVNFLKDTIKNKRSTLDFDL